MIINGTAGSDRLVGSNTFDIIDGGAGNDTIDGGSGNDKMKGGSGEDTFLGGVGADAMDGGIGTDIVDYSASEAGIKVYLSTGNGYGGQAEGDSFVSIEDVFGSHYQDLLIGNGGNNTLNGSAGNDRIIGGAGNDTIVGGHGVDQLTGGLDADTFAFRASWSGGMSGQDVITDFTLGQDKLQFIGNTVDDLGDLTFSQVGADTLMTYGSRGDSITLLNVDMNQLMANAFTDFLFT